MSSDVLTDSLFGELFSLLLELGEELQALKTNKLLAIIVAKRLYVIFFYEILFHFSPTLERLLGDKFNRVDIDAIPCNHAASALEISVIRHGTEQNIGDFSACRFLFLNIEAVGILLFIK